MSEEDIWADPAVKIWAQHVIDDMVPQMEESSVVFSLVSPGEGDVKFWVELGAAVMMDKPLVAVVLDDAEVPPKLALVADEIVRLPKGVNPQGSEEFAAAIGRILERLST